MTSNPSAEDVPQWSFMGRHPERLKLLSAEYKWEFTRRHPYYLWFWEYTGHDSPDLTEPERNLRSVCQNFLRVSLGVNAFPSPPPNQSFEELARDIHNPAWIRDAVSPVGIRNLLINLVHTLPPECLRNFAEFMTAYAETHPQDELARYHLTQDLFEGQHPNFDEALPSLMVTLNPHASLRDITASIEEIVSEHKHTFQIPETRRREDKYPGYLQVWDLREGWNGNGYDNRSEMKLKEICQELKISLSTAFSRYEKAFELLTGHEFSPRRWGKIMGLVKFSDLPEVATPIRASSRPTSDRITRVSQSDDPFAFENQDPAGLMAAAGMNAAAMETLMDLTSMLDAGRTSEEIAAALDIHQENLPSIDFIRQRVEEFRELEGW